MNIRWLNNLIVLSLIACFSFLAYIVGIFLYPFNPVDIIKVALVTEQVHDGERVYYKVDYCKHLPLPAQVENILINENSEQVWLVETESSNVQTGCGQVERSMLLPVNLPRGLYHIEVRVYYLISSIKRVEVVYQTPQFSVQNN